MDAIGSWFSELVGRLNQIDSASVRAATAKMVEPFEEKMYGASDYVAATASNLYQSIPFQLSDSLTARSDQLPINEPIFDYTFFSEMSAKIANITFEDVNTYMANINITDINVAGVTMSDLNFANLTMPNVSLADLSLPSLPMVTSIKIEIDFTQINVPTLDQALASLAGWYLMLHQCALLMVTDMISTMQSYDPVTLYCFLALVSILLWALLYPIFHYYFHLCGPGRIYSQHLPHTATQLPPSDVAIDTSVGGVHAVWKTLTDKDGSFRQLMRQAYRPTPWLALPNMAGHLQTLFTARAPPSLLSTPMVTYKREIIPVSALSPFLLPGEVALDWGVLGLACGSSNQVQEWHKRFTSTTPTVIICHGLAGGSSEHYVLNTIFYLSTVYGYRCVVFNARGCGGSKILNRQLYCGAYTDDLRQVVDSIRSRLPSAPLLAIGFSLGSNILTKFAGEEGLAGRPPPFTAMASIANPFDFILGARCLEASWFQRTIYSANLAKSLVRLFSSHLDVDGITDPNPPYDLKDVYASPSLREFDKRLTRVVFGYATVDDYYRDASSCRFVKFLRCPALLLNALDDPISPRGAIPYDEACINPYVTLITTEAGGHSMDWYQGWFKLTSWSTTVIGTYFSSIVANTPGLPAHLTTGDKVATPPHYANASIMPSSIDCQSALESIRLAALMSPIRRPETELSLADSVDAAVELQAKLLQLESVLNAAGAEADGIQSPLFDQDEGDEDEQAES